MKETPRRPLRSRETKWAATIAGWLTRAGVRPNQISVASAVFGALAGFCLFFTSSAGQPVRVALFIGAAACIQLRLLCNLFDGMVAVEGGLRSKSGEIYNDLPDRVSDAAIFIGAGYSITGINWGGELGWLAALLAVLTAYVRLLGGSTGARQYFAGPMAKQHRMAVMTAACLIAEFEAAMDWEGRAITYALALIVLGCAVTIVRRIGLIVQDLESK
ncbi:MAG TPA: CDP-alcohol phosphatidyltransferase family protein [Candidatus Binatia bacterium]|jgi:phosphatidylglycerophosphate synthase